MMIKARAGSYLKHGFGAGALFRFFEKIKQGAYSVSILLPKAAKYLFLFPI
jgi:hypothetical protein